MGDLEQLLLPGGITYKPKTANIKFTLGYRNVITGAYGSNNSTTSESRIYQEVIFPVQFGNRFYTNTGFVMNKGQSKVKILEPDIGIIYF